MTAVHVVGPLGYHLPLIRTWKANGLQGATHVKPEPGDSQRWRDIMGPEATLVARFTNDNSLNDSAIQQRYEADPAAEAQRLWDIYAPMIAVNPLFTAWQFNNEPVLGSGAERAFRLRRLAEFTRAIIDLANANGQGVALFNFARGTPEPHEWPLLFEVWRYAIAKNKTLPRGKKNFLSRHQYGSFNKAGPGSLFHDEAFHLKRHELTDRPVLPPDLRAAEYFMTEGGPDGGQHELRGWQQVYGRNDAGRKACVDDWDEYNDWLADQEGCLGSSFFSLNQEGGFGTFDIYNDPIAMMLATRKYRKLKPAKGGAPVPPQNEPQPPTIPPVVNLIRLIIVWLSQLGKNADYALGDCIQACIAGLLRSLGHDVTVNDVARKTNLPANYTWSELVKHGVRVAALKPWNVELMWVGRITPNILRAQLLKRKSAIVLTKYNKLKKRYDPKYTQNHAITVHGFEGEYFFYDDPYWPEAQRKDGEDIKIHQDDLFAAMNAIDAETPAQGLFLMSHTLQVVGGTPPVPVEKPSREKLLYEASVAIDRQEREGRKATADYMRRKWFEPALADPEAA